MNWRRMVGLDTLEQDYAFGSSDSTGYTAAKKIPDHWVPTTCGYCSVGCGIELGVKDGKAIASRPHAAHPVNRGKLCPKGLSEHYIIDVVTGLLIGWAGVRWVYCRRAFTVPRSPVPHG